MSRMTRTFNSIHTSWLLWLVDLGYRLLSPWTRLADTSGGLPSRLGSGMQSTLLLSEMIKNLKTDFSSTACCDASTSLNLFFLPYVESVKL